MSYTIVAAIRDNCARGDEAGMRGWHLESGPVGWLGAPAGDHEHAKGLGAGGRHGWAQMLCRDAHGNLPKVVNFLVWAFATDQ